jgi:hypothetical protein
MAQPTSPEWRSFFTFGGSAERVPEAWLEHELVPGKWIAAFRLVEEDGRMVIGEIRVFPYEQHEIRPDGRRRPRRPRGRWSAEQLGTRAPAPPGGLTARVLQKVRVTKALEQAGEKVEGWRRTLGRAQFDYAFDRHQFTEAARRRPGRRGRSDRFYAELAVEYARAMAAGSRTPVKDLARELALPESAVRDLVHQARVRGLLTRSGRGQPGGQPTERARALLKDR